MAYLIYMIAGLGAGVVTGLAGLSAASVISPILITLLGFDPFMAIGISLASDVLASALSAATYAKNGHMDVKGGLWLLLPAMVLTVFGCILGYSVSSTALGMVSCLFPIGLGIKFLIAKEAKPLPFVQGCSTRTRHLLYILSGAVVGTICGFSGAGGGMMMLFLLTSLLSYELKTAVGTSVFIMTFLALVGAISHFTMLGEINWTALVICALSALLGAWLASRFANRATPRLLNRVIGACLVLLGAFLTLFKFVL